MARVDGVEIENFRCFQKLRVEGFTRVNLFVGRNNSGKTALLEALEAVVSEDSAFLLYRASTERGEVRRAAARGGTEPSLEADVRLWIHGHRLEPGESFSVNAWGDKSRHVMRSIERVTEESSPPFVSEGLLLTLHRDGRNQKLARLPLTADGWLGIGLPTTFADQGARLNPPVRFVPTRRLNAAELIPMWSRVLLRPEQDEVEQAMRTLDPRIQRLAVVGGGADARAFVSLSGVRDPVPLGTLGEGATRMLTLALMLVTTSGGFVFIDEIETGLHYSVHRDLWRMVIETAKRLDVQVFATTHSKDVMEAIARLHEDAPELAAEVTVHRLEAGASTSVRMTAATIAGTVDGQVDVR